MRAVVQRVTRAQVVSGGEVVGAIGPGLCVLVGVTHDDTEASAKRLADKLWNLRIMADAEGVMNLSIADTTRSLLVVSQFTLYGDT
ncbi:MAG: D-tyrosyl-tRNA(Tyr) deacylase, partial [Actinobacteria bacterium]|nr:D-tyrosyl-tRNA(Tyr) deacylase [Actinomycetota bacterium]MSY13719.1 D-tyrosyl-tRNA(Tyr) deacylase [Actinomycetota bacterium]